MLIQNEKDVISLIQEDKWMMDLLKCAKSLNLPDWWICAGFVRSKIWDVLHGFGERTTMPDIDVIYYDAENIEEIVEKQYEETLGKLLSTVPWSVKNQARMHIANNISPYSSSVDAIGKFPETATSFGVKLDERNNVILAAPHGIQDAVNLIVKPTPYFLESRDRMLIYKKRVREKNWQATWGNIEMMNLEPII
ncbi:nucleotidyltransferase family protein [Sporosarcina sp. FSL K6-2383]|uniref:nucleotidyltransferase family protein n=1 Tax=Sporosarcina sp. FSL K6-2383 TaxID=2921556 RepID=UPI003159D6A0